MTLSNSVFASIGTVLAVWLGLLYQPGPVAAQAADVEPQRLAAEVQPLTASMPRAQEDRRVQPPSVHVPRSGSELAPQAEAPVVLVGISERLALSDVAFLWSRFVGLKTLHTRLRTATPVVYVLYEDLSPDYQQARVTIGYASGALLFAEPIGALPAGEFTELLSQRPHTDAQLRQAWSKLDYTRQLRALVERHQLDASGRVSSVGVSVLYR